MSKVQDDTTGPKQLSDEKKNQILSGILKRRSPFWFWKSKSEILTVSDKVGFLTTSTQTGQTKSFTHELLVFELTSSLICTRINAFFVHNENLKSWISFWEFPQKTRRRNRVAVVDLVWWQNLRHQCKNKMWILDTVGTLRSKLHISISVANPGIARIRKS